MVDLPPVMGIDPDDPPYEVCRDDRCPVLGIHKKHTRVSGHIARTSKLCPWCKNPMTMSAGGECCDWARDRKLGLKKGD